MFVSVGAVLRGPHRSGRVPLELLVCARDACGVFIIRSICKVRRISDDAPGYAQGDPSFGGRGYVRDVQSKLGNTLCNLSNGLEISMFVLSGLPANRIGKVLLPPLLIWGLSLLLGLSPSAQAGDKEEIAKLDATLGKRGIKRSGSNWVLEGEAKLKKCLDTEKAIRNEMKKKLPDYQAMEEEEYMRNISVPKAFERIAELDQLLAQNLPVTQHNQLVAERNSLVATVNKYRSDKIWPEQLRKARAEWNKIRERYMENMLDARKVANDLDSQWKALEEDTELQEIAKSLSELTKQTVVAGPARGFKKMLADLEKLEGNVLTDVIPLQNSGGNTFHVSVVINGKETVEMVLDSGAGIISLPSATADAIGVSANENSEDIRLVLADGRTVVAKKVSIPTVRVGRFEVKNVDAAILPTELANAEPLLGMSFLKNFQFKVDADAKTLTITEVGIGEDGDKKGNAPNSKPKKK